MGFGQYGKGVGSQKRRRGFGSPPIRLSVSLTDPSTLTLSWTSRLPGGTQYDLYVDGVLEESDVTSPHDLEGLDGDHEIQIRSGNVRSNVFFYTRSAAFTDAFSENFQS